MWKKLAKGAANETGGLLPLDEIRKEEANIASHLIQARQQAEAIRAAAIQQAEQLKQKASLEGTQDGQNARASRYTEAQNQASQIIRQAREAAEGFSAQTGDQVDTAVERAKNLVFGVEERGQQK